MRYYQEIKLSGITEKDNVHLNNYVFSQEIFCHQIATKKELEQAKKTPGCEYRHNKVTLEGRSKE